MWDGYLSGAGIEVDHECKLFQCVFGTNLDTDFDWNTKTNRMTGMQPIIWHANGRADLAGLRRRLGLVSVPSAWHGGQGAAMWAELHQHKPDATTGAFLDGFAARIPCGECRQHWQDLVKRSPPPTDLDGWRRWTHEAHQEVNRRLGRGGMTLVEAVARWGW